MRRYLVFVSASLGLLMYSIDSTAVAVAFPNFIKDFDTNILWAAWTISIYLIAVTSVMPLMGNLSDGFGRKKVFLISLSLFTASSFACGLAPNIYSLVAFRFLQGVGGASFLPTAAGIVSDQFPENRERAIGLFTSIFPIGGIVGPNLGGWIVSRYSWRYIFYINLPIGMGLAVLILILLKGSKILSRPHIDFVGASFFFGAILFLMLGLNLIAESFSPSSLLLTILFLIVSLSFFFLFFYQEKKDPNPILDMALLKSKPFLAANLYNMMIGAGVFGTLAFIPLYATSVHKLSTLVSGVILTPRSLGIIPASAITSFLLKRWGYRWPMLLGLSIISFSTILLDSPGLQLLRIIGIHSGVAEILAILIMMSGIGIGIALPASNNACIELMPEKVATITGLRGMFRSVGGAFGISLITIILHSSSTPLLGFRATFLSFGLGLLLCIPLVFLMPTGKKGRGAFPEGSLR
ncbi:MAG TPA: DHA2 family efflux MFS transporter permease subunit [Thermodesulfobacteriota bacterium]|nr:DHA2 family efflux MFS transporter permease subunit [Thermodesulfobacteriota bacterium]